MRTLSVIAAVALALCAGPTHAQSGAAAARFPGYTQDAMVGLLSERCMTRGLRVERPQPGQVRCIMPLQGREKLAAGLTVGGARQRNGDPYTVIHFEVVGSASGSIVQVGIHYEAEQIDGSRRIHRLDSKEDTAEMRALLVSMGGEPL